MMLKRGKAKSYELNMTPMIDVVFQLLIFFLVATQIKQTEESIPLKLPLSTEALLDIIKGKPLIVQILPQTPNNPNPYVVNGRFSNHADLDRVLRAYAQLQYLKEGHKLIDVRIRADRRATLDQLRSVLDACARENILHVYIAAEKIAKKT